MAAPPPSPGLNCNALKSTGTTTRCHSTQGALLPGFRINSLIAPPLREVSLSAKSVSAIGFLTVVQDDQYGHCGGYLLLNDNGRPLEFHCTAPVKPNRAQEVLYGPTLRPFLHGELIGQTLVERAKVEPIVICSDAQSVLALRPSLTMPLVLVQPDDQGAQVTDLEGGRAYRSSSAGIQLRVDPQHDPEMTCSHLHRFSCAGSLLAVSSEFAADEQMIRQRLEPHSSRLDLAEPFERIREAIREAQGNKR